MGEPETVWTLKKRKSLASAGKRTTILWPNDLLPSHYTDRAMPAILLLFFLNKQPFSGRHSKERPPFSWSKIRGLYILLRLIPAAILPHTGTLSDICVHSELT